MKKYAVWGVVAVVVTILLSPVYDAAAVQYYRRFLPNKTLSCTPVGGGLTLLLINNQDVAYSNPTNSATFRYVVVLNGTTIFTSEFSPAENGVGTQLYAGFGENAPIAYPVTIALRNETFVNGVEVYESTVRGTCTGPSIDNPTIVFNTAYGESTFRRWRDDKTATCALNGAQATAQLSNQNVEYNNFSGQDRYTRMVIDEGVQTLLTGAPLTEPGNGSVAGGTADYDGNLLTSTTGFPLDMQYIIDSYAPDGTWRYRSTITITCAASGAAQVTVEDFPSDGALTVVSGTLDLQGRPPGASGARSVPVTAAAYGNSVSGRVFSRNLTSSINGTFSFTGLAPATYTFYVKTSTTLRISQTVTVTLAGVSPTFGVMREGDANNDNVINISDFSILAAAFGSSIGGGSFNSSADFNKDGVVNISDFSLLAGNFGQAGVALP